MFRAGPAGIRTTGVLARLPLGYLDDDRAEGCIRSLEHAYSKDGGGGAVRQFRRKRLYRENRRRGRQHPEIYRSGESI